MAVIEPSGVVDFVIDNPHPRGLSGHNALLSTVTPYSPPLGGSVVAEFNSPVRVDAYSGDFVVQYFVASTEGSGEGTFLFSAEGLGDVPVVFIGVGDGPFPFSAEGYGSAGTAGAGEATFAFSAEGEGDRSTRRRLNYNRAGLWGTSKMSRSALGSSYPTAVPADPSRHAPWSPSSPVQRESHYAWGSLKASDLQLTASWGAALRFIIQTDTHSWKSSMPADALRAAVWGQYGGLYRQNDLAGWVASVPADVVKDSPWYGYLSPMRLGDFVPDSLGSGDFVVLAPGIRARLSSGAFSAPLGNAIELSAGFVGYHAPSRMSSDLPSLDVPLEGDFQTDPPSGISTTLHPSGVFAGFTGRWGLAVSVSQEDTVVWDRYNHYVQPGTGGGNPNDPVVDPNDPVVVDSHEVYIVQNSFTLVLDDTNEPVLATAFSASTNSGSWCWSCSATVPYFEQSKLISPTGDPVILRATVNGYDWRMLVESVSERRAFGSTEVSVSGRSLTAMLEAPYAGKRSHTYASQLKAAQVIVQEMERESLLYTCNWGIATSPDPNGWNVLAGTLSYQNATPMSVMNMVVSAVGGYLFSDPSELGVYAKPKYPIAPWGWAAATPDVSIPKDIVIGQSITPRYSHKYNAVYVSGQDQGVTAFVKLTGTNGDDPAEPVVNPLIGDEVAAREAGVSILGDMGKIANVTLDTILDPLLGGLIIPGLLLEVRAEGDSREPTWRGLTRGVQVTAQWSDSLEVSQSVEVERHYLEVAP